jgi:hypothetical protein
MRPGARLRVRLGARLRPPDPSVTFLARLRYPLHACLRLPPGLEPTPASVPRRSPASPLRGPPALSPGGPPASATERLASACPRLPACVIPSTPACACPRALSPRPPLSPGGRLRHRFGARLRYRPVARQRQRLSALLVRAPDCPPALSPPRPPAPAPGGAPGYLPRAGALVVQVPAARNSPRPVLAVLLVFLNPTLLTSRKPRPAAPERCRAPECWPRGPVPLWELAAVPVLSFLSFHLARSPRVQPRGGASPLETVPLWGRAALLLSFPSWPNSSGCRLAACLASQVSAARAGAPRVVQSS